MQIRKIFSSRARLFRAATILLICIALLLYVLSAPKFEDGFESDFGLWDDVSPQPKAPGSPSIVQDPHHHGGHSARFNSTLSQDHRSYLSHRVAPESINLYARGYFYVSASNLDDYGNRSVLIAFRAGNDSIPDLLPVAYTGWRNVNGSVRWYLSIMNGSGGYEVILSNMEPVLSRWYSVELHWREGDVGEMWVDDVLACSSEGTHTSQYGSVDWVRFGLAETVTGGPTIVYVDCVAISGSRIWSEAIFASPRNWYLVIGTVSACMLVAEFLVGKWRVRSWTNTSRDEETVVY
jgi:hypothetical protein